MNIRLVLPILVALALPVATHAQTLPDTLLNGNDLAPPPSREMVIGKPMFVASHTAVCGPLEAQYPFDPSSFGKERGWNPVGSKEAKIVLFTRALDARFFRFAAAVDKLVAKDPRLFASQVVVIDDKGAQWGSYTATEIQARQKEIRELVSKHDVSHLSFFLSGQGAGGILPRLGLTPVRSGAATDSRITRTDPRDTNLLLVYLTENTPPKRFAVLQWSTPLQTTRLDPETIARTMDSLQAAIAKK